MSRKKIAVILFLLVLVLLLIISLAEFVKDVHSIAKKRIDYIAFNEIGNETNQTLLINKILVWEKENIVDMNLKENEKYPCIRIPDDRLRIIPLFQDYSLITITRCGRCGEFAEVFSEIANKFGIKNSIISADNINGGNHAWVEILTGNETVPLETSDLKGYNLSRFYDWYNASKFYNCKFLIQYRNIRAQDGEDVSKRYYSWCS